MRQSRNNLYKVGDRVIDEEGDELVILAMDEMEGSYTVEYDEIGTVIGMRLIDSHLKVMGLDPDANLSKQNEVIDRLVSTRETMTKEECSAAVIELAALVRALDYFLRDGGRLPQRWGVR